MCCFTGSQVPLGLPRSDAVAHLQAALQLAAGPRLRNVGLVFNNRLLNGSRLRKVSSQQFQAFDTPNAARWPNSISARCSTTKDYLMSVLPAAIRARPRR
ncbi:asparaginase domain-containing protein [Halopseudomonas pachastrellae]|nr:asparaginase domain-containing protein [Halopseudomonas pachastrellae]